MFSSEFVISPGTLVKNFLERNNISKKDVVSKTNLSATDLERFLTAGCQLTLLLQTSFQKFQRRKQVIFLTCKADTTEKLAI